MNPIKSVFCIPEPGTPKQIGGTCAFYALQIVAKENAEVDKIHFYFRNRISESDLSTYARNKSILQKYGNTKLKILHLSISEKKGAKERTVIYRELLETLGKIPTNSELSSELKIQYKALDCLAKLYGCAYSDWEPTQTIEQLMAILKKTGPLEVCGMFSKNHRTTHYSYTRNYENRPVYAWLSSQEKPTKSGHAVVVVGAQILLRQGIVFYLDPVDGSKKDDPSSQILYSCSYEDFCDRIIPQSLDETGYALYLEKSN